jgi:hypothetical protein
MDEEEPIELTEEETLVVLSFDPSGAMEDLSESTGLPIDQVELLVERLSRLGVLEKNALDPATNPVEDDAGGDLIALLDDSLADLLPSDRRERVKTIPREEEDDPAPRAAARVPALAKEVPRAQDVVPRLLDAARLDRKEKAERDDAKKKDDDEAAAKKDAKDAAEKATDEASGDQKKDDAKGDESKEKSDESADAKDVDDVDDAKDEEKAEEEESPDAAVKTREYHKLYETTLHPLSADERVALAKTETGDVLFALCFAPEPEVVHALFENMAAGLDHARLIAFHHRSSRGLELLVVRASFARDPMIYRRLLRNPGLTDGQLKRLLMGKRLMEVYKTSLDREAPEKTRVAARGLLRQRFTAASPEERIELVWNTEGRVLVLLTGCTFDSKMTTILCQKQFVSVMLVQSLARFSATPPTVIAAMLRSPMVKRQPHLRNMILQHQNTPGDLKRRGG